MDKTVFSGSVRKGEMHKTFKIFCGNLAGAATKDDLYYLFSQYGPVVEAVVMVGKYYGFVHMAYEEDGWKAICELRGYFLHGKAMAVEASINAKRATPFYRHIIGKGMSTLDDFGDYNSSKSKAAEALRERRLPTDQIPSFGQQQQQQQQQVGESSTGVPQSSAVPVFPYPPPYPTSVAQSSPLGHTPPPPLSRASPMPDYQTLKSYDPMKGRESPVLKMSHVDANSNPVQEPMIERHENMVPSGLCSICGSMFDEWQHTPKILSCGHTFCCDCLLSLARDTEIKCPVNCPYTTALTGAGITGEVIYDSQFSSLSLPPDNFVVEGLTTNNRVPIKTFITTSIPQSLGLPSGYVLQNGAQRPNSVPPTTMVCCTCPKMTAVEYCSSQGHQLIPEGQARGILQGHLQSAQEMTLKQLRQAMTMRATMKERLERTLQSVEKFLEELRRKVEGEQLEEAVLQEHLADLTVANEALSEGAPIAQLIESLNKVQYYSSVISLQFNQCAAITAINNATEAIVIKLKQTALESVLSSIGFRSEEAFAMSSSLEEHAMYGNNANVLLLYMLSDLLSTRMAQLTVSPMNTLSPSQQPSLSASSPMQQPQQPPPPPPPPPAHLPPPPITPVSVAVMEDPMSRSLGLGHGKVNDMKNHDIGKLNELKNQQEMNNVNVEHILQMTEAIETGSLLGSNDGIGGASVVGSNSVSSALSLGLSNLSFLASEPSENGKDELESILDKKEPNPVSYVDAAKKPAKPTPPPPDTPTKMHMGKMISQYLRSGKFPHCWMVLSIDSIMAGRIIFELRPDKAPRMCENFIALCTGRNGYGYKGTHFFRSGEGFLAGGDVENDDGTGGYSAFDKTTFEADLCPLKDEVGMIRFKGIGTTEKGRGMIGSQFMIWCGDRDFKRFSYSLVFGKVVDGLDVAKKAAAINVHRVSVRVEECGVI
ncbi:hypothetical protein Pcinc_031034 [Petrolisthes cinctipes]|uniref:Cyclophilin E n=1 Tax=Petrolisthes cinctipes TaxID=88211 RepID=A0AAE1EX62_PETCI|nr:hypothetical protein Pcinc_031034 [Petrolisthes cinctipes]